MPALRKVQKKVVESNEESNINEDKPKSKTVANKKNKKNALNSPSQKETPEKPTRNSSAQLKGDKSKAEEKNVDEVEKVDEPTSKQSKASEKKTSKILKDKSGKLGKSVRGGLKDENANKVDKDKTKNTANTKSGRKAKVSKENQKEEESSEELVSAEETSKTDKEAKEKRTVPVPKKATKKARDSSDNAGPMSKKFRLSGATFSSMQAKSGIVLSVGEGDTGQLGLGPDVMDRTRPAKVELPKSAVQICAGGMHSVCVTSSGEVYTFGCNDEGALGRVTNDDDECTEPRKVDLNEKIIQVSAGDSHTAALSELGHVYIWGTFRDANGVIGINPGEGKIDKPIQIMKEHVVVKVASGSDHLVCLTEDGDIYTLGSSELGQLGRVAECFSVRGGRRGLAMTLTPAIVHFKKRNLKFCNIWAGTYVTFAKAAVGGEIYAWGLNNYYQLGFPDMQNKFIPEKSNSFVGSNDWQEISGGQHHTIARDAQGNVYCLGRKEYGRLGLGEENLEEKSAPTLVASLSGKKCVSANCGAAVSYAVVEDGTIYGWGMGSTKQLGQGDDEDDVYEPKPIAGKQLEKRLGLMASAGGQHTLFLVTDQS